LLSSTRVATARVTTQPRAQQRSTLVAAAPRAALAARKAAFVASRPAAVFSRSAVSTTTTRARVTTMANLGDFTMDNIDGKPTKLSTYQGKVCLVVNVASK
jgi:cytochrome oxidase Cu insertion factor (SCO1/SenC/PrrC family)